VRVVQRIVDLSKKDNTGVLLQVLRGSITQYNNSLLGRFLLILVVLSVSACAARGPQVSESDLGAMGPEVRELTFRGNKAFSAWTLRKEMETKPRAFPEFWKRGSDYDPSTLEADVLHLRKFYFDRGFLNTTVRIAKVQKYSEKNAVSIEVEIEEGQETVVKSVHIAGKVPPELPSKEVLLAALPLRPGKAINKEQFDKSKSKLLLRMQNAGYARAQLVPHTEVDAERHEAIVTYTLEPGRRTYIGGISIEGLDRVPEYVIRRQLDIEKGDAYSIKALRDNQTRLYDLGMFRSVTPRLLNINEVGAPLEVEFAVHERKPRTFQLGIGASSVESMRYEIKWTHRNLFKEAERLFLLARISGILQGMEAELDEPYFLNRDTSLTHKLFIYNNKRIDTDPFGILDSIFKIVDPQPGYNLLTMGGESRIKHNISKRLTGTLGIELTQNDFYDVDPSLVEDLESVKDNKLFIQFGALEWNTRDDNLNPTRGELLSAKIDLSNTSLLSDVDFAKLTLEGRYYLQFLRRTVFATRLKVGGIEPYGQTRDVPSNVRFYAGGPGSVRGYLLNRVGPLDASGNPLGGSSLLEGSLELRFPLTDSFSGALFVDFGNVWSTPFTYHLDDLRYAVGPGVRYLTPIGPLRFDIGFVIDRREGENFSRFDVSIGQAF
jgi:outer membrane protein assembly complex protein YaeT